MIQGRATRAASDVRSICALLVKLLLGVALVGNLVIVEAVRAQAVDETTNGGPLLPAERAGEFDEDPPALATPLRWGEVIRQSLFGPLSEVQWRPLGLDTLFSEGWDEPYARAPNLAGEGAPRQPWVNDADGAFYRLYVFSFAYARGLPGNTDAYGGSFIAYTPFSRRFELGWVVPCVVSAPDALDTKTLRYWTDFGDLTIIPRVLLAEDVRYTVTSNLFVRLPTGSIRDDNGAASLSPDVEFWANPRKRWVVRGGLGVTVPTNETRARLPILAAYPFTGVNASPSALTSFDARLAIGDYITDPDAPFLPDFVYYVVANLHTAVSGGHATYFSLTPGFMFGLGNNWYFRGGLEVPLVGPMPFQTQTIFQLIKNF